jgi:transcriptional antiterminator
MRKSHYCIKKILNNNAVVTVDFNAKCEVIFMGKGIGFGKKVNEPFTYEPSMKKYELQRKSEKGTTDALVNTIDPLYVEIAAQIVDLAAAAFGEGAIDSNILLPLADHIAFSVVRMRAGMDMSNPFSEDIRLLYEEEYAVGLKAKAIIESRAGFTIPDGELAYIVLYIHSALNDTKVAQSLRVPQIIHESIRRIQDECGISEIGEFAYHRLMYHIKCMLARVNANEKLNQDMIAFTREKCPYSFATAQDICRQIGEELHTTFTDAEVSFLALHIERIKACPQD